MRMIFAKDTSRIGRKHSWNLMKRRKQELGRVQFVRVKSLRWWFVINFLAAEPSNCSILDVLKNTYWQTFLVCRAGLNLHQLITVDSDRKKRKQ